MADKPAVLFVCVHNAGRSQMAAALLTHLAGDRIEVRSAGTEPADQINPAAVAAMAELGIDITANMPNVLTADTVQTSDVVITMGCGDTCPYFPGVTYRDWNLPDPADEVGNPGMVEDLESDEQMLDTAVAAAIEVLAAGNDIGPSSVESAFVDLLSTLGPRAAAAVRDLTKTLDRARFDIDIAWRQPARTTRRVRVTARSAAYIADVVEHANLDEQPVTIIGDYLTVSAVASWLIQQDDGDTITVKLGRIDPTQTKGLAVGERIRIEAIMKTETTAGGSIKTTYTAQTFERLDPSD